MKMDYYDEMKMSNDTQNAETVFLSDAEHPSDASAGHTYSVGDTIEDLYQVKSEPISGGMGSVICVHHSSWNVDLAMKQPNLQTLDDARRELFVHECEAWINLGLHRNIVACYYVRVIDGVPSIFSEWMDGGSLKDQIVSKHLYKGNSNEILVRIIDIMIQSARGLAFAHSKGLIHQDVKPANILCNKGGDIKIADFGLANVKKLIISTDATDSGKTAFAANGGYTLQYCSPEQIKGLPLSARSDIWSWAVTALEMFVGECKWSSGPLAGYAFESYLTNAIVPVPDTIKALLSDCFHEKENDRPHDFDVILSQLMRIYSEIYGTEYPIEQDYDSQSSVELLNNKALSFLDLGKKDEAISLWEKGLELAPDYAPVQYNYTLYKWRTGVISDLDAIKSLKTLAAKSDSPELAYGLASIYCESGRYSAARDLLNISLAAFPNDSRLLMMQQLCDNKPDAFSVISELIIDEKKEAFKPWCFQLNHANGFFYLIYYFPNDSTNLVVMDKNGEIISQKIVGTCSEEQIDAFTFSNDYSQIIVQRDNGSIDALDSDTLQVIMHVLEWEEGFRKPAPGIWGDVETGLIATYDSPDEGLVWAVIREKKVTHLISEKAIRKMAEKKSSNSISPETKDILTDNIRFEFLCSLVLNTSYEQQISISFFNPDGTITIGEHCITLLRDGLFSINEHASKELKQSDLHVQTNNSYYQQHDNAVSISRGVDCIEVTNCSTKQKIITYSCEGTWVKHGNDLTRVYTLEDKGVVIRNLFANRFFCDYMLSRVISVSDMDQLSKQFASYYSIAKEKYNKGEIETALHYINLASAVPGFNKNQKLMELNREVGRFCVIESFWNCELGIKSIPSNYSCVLGCDRSKRYLRIKEKGIFDVLSNKMYASEDNTSRLILGKSTQDLPSFLSSNRAKLGNNLFLFGLGSWDHLFKAGENQSAHEEYRRIVLEQLNRRTFSVGDSNRINTFLTDDKENLLITQRDDGLVERWDLCTGEKKDSYRFRLTTNHLEQMIVKDVSPDGSTIAVFDHKESTISIWNSRAFNQISVLDGKENSVENIYHLVYVAYIDNEHLLTCNDEGQVVVWNISAGKPETIIKPTEVELNLSGYRISDRCLVRVSTEYGSISPNSRFFLIPMTNFGKEGSSYSLLLYDLKEKSVRYIAADINLFASIGPACIFTANKHMLVTCEQNRNSKEYSRETHYLNWKYMFPGWADWDDGALPIVEQFLGWHESPTSKDIEDLMLILQNKDYGWLRREGIVRKVNELVQERRAKYRNEGRCEYCGGRFKGLFRKACENCGRPKNY